MSIVYPKRIEFVEGQVGFYLKILRTKQKYPLKIMCEDPKAKINFFMLYDGTKANFEEYDERQSGSAVRFKGNDAYSFMNHMKFDQAKYKLRMQK